MSDLIVDYGNGPTDGNQIAKPIVDRIRAGREHRKQFEPTWHSNLAFAAGKHWLEWDRFNRALVMPADLRNKELYGTDVITEYRTSALGELGGGDDDRPQLLLRRDDAPSEHYQEQLNKAIAYGWDNEWHGDDALEETDQLVVDLGTAAVWCKFDPNFGPTVGDVPYMGGTPNFDALKDGPNPNVEMRQAQQGRICWPALSPFNLIVPPGIPREQDFPWECVIRPVLLVDVQAEFGDVANSLKEDGDIGSVYGWTTEAGGGDTAGGKSRLRDHVWLFTYLERPTKIFPNGRTVTLAGNKMIPLRFDDKLPVCGADGSYRSGLSYFHWWRVTGRFWSRSLVEVMKDPQRGINKRRTQITEIIDRAMPYTLVEENSKALDRAGVPGEFIELGKQERTPVSVAGSGPGAWMQQDVEAMREDLEHATGIKGVRLGENPGNVDTYSQLALINENDQSKRQGIHKSRRKGIGQLVESSVYLMRTYWGPQRQVALDGDEDEADAAIFNATKIPTFFIVRNPKGASRPTSAAAEVQKVQDIWNASAASGAVLRDPDGWVRWYKDSLDAGEVLDLPGLPGNDQQEKAELENHNLLQGEEVLVDYYDPPEVHIPAHRIAQNQARISGDLRAYLTIEQHVQQHLEAAAENAARVQGAMGPPPGPPVPGQGPPAPGGPPPTGPPPTGPTPPPGGPPQ